MKEIEWLKVEDQLSDFERVVLLYEHKDDNHYVSTGYLSKVNKQGNHFVNYKAKDFGSIFGQAFETVNINPTHWAHITIPNNK